MGESSQRALKVFLSYASEDEPKVRKFYRRLLKSGVEPWFDREELLSGQDWKTQIHKAITATDIVIVCLSQNSITKTGYIQKELKLVLDAADEKPEGTIFIIPICLEDCEIPERLKHLQCLDLFKWGAYERLIKSLQECAGKIGSITTINHQTQIKSQGKSVQTTGSKREKVIYQHYRERGERPDDSLNRIQWLDKHGFPTDPFSQDALRGTEDPVLNKVDRNTLVEKFNSEAYILPPRVDMNAIIGTSSQPGIRYIFAPHGGGKSSLCRYIKNFLSDEPREGSLPPVTSFLDDLAKPDNILVIEYIHLNNQEIKACIKDIIELAKDEAVAKRIITEREKLDVSFDLTDHRILKAFVSQCQKNGISSIYVLVDEIKIKGSQPIAADFLRRVDLFSIAGIIFKFFLRIEVLDWARDELDAGSKFPYESIEWRNRIELLDLLKYRLKACILKIDERDEQFSEPFERFRALFSEQIEGYSVEKILDEFVNLALEDDYPTPRLMWKFGYDLLNRHFALTGGYRKKGELIELSTLYAVRDEALKDIAIKKKRNQSLLSDQGIAMDKNNENKFGINFNISGGNPQVNLGEKVTGTQYNNATEFLKALNSAAEIINNSSPSNISNTDKQHSLATIGQMKEDVTAGKFTEELKTVGKNLLTTLKKVPDFVEVISMLEPFIKHLK